MCISYIIKYVFPAIPRIDEREIVITNITPLFMIDLKQTNLFAPHYSIVEILFIHKGGMINPGCKKRPASTYKKNIALNQKKKKCSDLMT